MKRKIWCIILTMLVLLALCVNAFALPDTLIPVGKAVGIHLCGDLVVVGFDEEIGMQAKAAGVRPGDRIVSVNGRTPDSLEVLRTAAEGQDGVYLTVDRDGKEIAFYLSAIPTEEGSRVGLKVRDGITGIGTITYYDPQTGGFGALGHSVNDPETNECLPISDGQILEASVSEVQRGESGKPGELKGSFSADAEIGKIRKNAPEGIFGSFNTKVIFGEAIPVGRLSEIETARAEIRSNVQGTEVQTFGIMITRIDRDSTDGRDFMFEVCDDALIAKTGGIVQGMSGSPVIQDGKLIGAVTHVLVDNPCRGYGISIETMLKGAA